MTGTYICQYPTNEGKICGRPCYRQEGCAIHWKRRQRVLCLECGKPTASKYSLCNLHADKCHAKAFYYRNKLSKMVQNGQTIESLTRILNCCPLSLEKTGPRKKKLLKFNNFQIIEPFFE